METEKIKPTTSIIEFFTGMTYTASSLFLIYLAPWIFQLYFQIGLSGTNLILVLCLVPSLLLLIPLTKASQTFQRAFQIISGYVLVPLISLMGFLVIYAFNPNNINTMVLIDFVVALAIYNSQLDLHKLVVNSKLFLVENSPQYRFNRRFLSGLILPLLIFSICWVVIPTISVLFFGLAAFYLFRSFWWGLVKIDANLSPLVNTEKKHVLRPDLWFNFFAKWVLLMVQILITLYITSEQQIPIWGAWLIGVSIGIFLYHELHHQSSKIINLFIYLGLFGQSLVLWLDWSLFTTWPLILINGIFLGMTWGTFLDDFALKARQTLSPFFKLSQCFWIVALCVGIGLTAHEMKFLILDYSTLLWVIPLVVVGIVGICAGCDFLSQKLLFKRISSENLQKFLETAGLSFNYQGMSRKVLGVMLLMCFLNASAMTLVQFSSRASVFIQFNQTLYDVYGNPITSLNLNERSAEILLYTPHPVGIVHNESIRPGDSIRLGAYLYDTTAVGNLTKEQVMNWIGQNLDVYALGGYTDSYLFPNDTLTMRIMNNESRFYIMTFSTTLGENDSWTVDGAMTPYTSTWNATKESWTLKLKDGSEALGVRRTSNDSLAHLMDLGNMAWADYYAQLYNSRTQAYHANGVAIDEVMWEGYWGTDINNLQNYSSVSQITQTCYDWLSRVHNDSSMEIITQAYWPKAQQYQNGIWGELSFRAGGAYGTRVDDREAVVWYDSMNWQEIVENMMTMGEENRSDIWAAWYNQNDPAALEYCIATYLMGKVNGCTSVVFHPQPTYDGGYPYNLAGYSLDTVRQEINNHPEFFNLQMGDALGPMVLMNGIGGQYWERNFTNGIVLVNPFHAYVPGFDYNPPPNPSF